MPRFDLRSDRETLDPLAPFKVLPVMCHPKDPIERERMLGLIQRETGMAQPRRTPLTAEQFVPHVNRSWRRAAVAGHLLLTMLQLRHNGYRGSLNEAMSLVAAIFPEWRQHQGPEYSKDDHLKYRPRSRRKMLEAYRQFRSVAHLVAAMVHGDQHDRKDIWPGSLKTLPTFLAYADCILDMACNLPSLARDRRFAINRSEAWVFTIPEMLIRTVPLVALPLTEEQGRILNEHESRKLLIRNRF